MRVREAHVFSVDRGHTRSKDCWCEPVKVYYVTGKDGLPVRVIEHNDDATQATHSEVEKERCLSPDWITTLLDGVEGGEDE